MWPFRRKRKSSRGDLKQVYYYKEDFITLKALSKQDKTSMTRLAHDILLLYLGYKYGNVTGDIQGMQRDIKLLAGEFSKTGKELKLYEERFGEIVA